jgi:hypothetical protein
VLGSVGWQQWSKFGQVELGVDNTTDPRSITTELDFKDTWHFLQSTAPVAAGGRGNLVGSYDSIGTLFLALYANWKF